MWQVLAGRLVYKNALKCPYWRQVAGAESRVAKSRARASDAILRFPMVPPWLATCSCGWVSAAQTLDELVILIDVHQDQASLGQRHPLVLKGTLDVPHVSPPRRRLTA
jgi:hypothetical protein